MRLGGPIFEAFADPVEWAQAVQQAGYRAAYCPAQVGDAPDLIRAYEQAAADHDIVIAEVGAWSNPLSPNDAKRREALDKCKTHLALADEIGANCCVNIPGSRSERWDGPDPLNLTADTFDFIVETVRDIIDAVQPRRTWYTLETMPWIYPNSPETYERLLRAIDRERFGVHLDPVNLIVSPEICYNNAALIRECFASLGPRIRSCHGKDIILRREWVVHLDETRPGTGVLDYRVFITEINRVNPDLPLMLEHLPDAGEYRLAADYVRQVAATLA